MNITERIRQVEEELAAVSAEADKLWVVAREKDEAARAASRVWCAQQTRRGGLDLKLTVLKRMQAEGVQ